jgi:hypothetical protein
VTPCGANKTLPVPEDDDEEKNPHDHAGWISRDIGDEPTEQPKTSTTPKTLASSQKDQLTSTLSLVHGDMLVFFGDDFEVNIAALVDYPCLSLAS